MRQVEILLEEHCVLLCLYLLPPCALVRLDGLVVTVALLDGRERIVRTMRIVAIHPFLDIVSRIVCPNNRWQQGVLLHDIL